MDRIGCLTKNGIIEFGRYLQRLSQDGRIPPPRSLLTDVRYSQGSRLCNASVEPRGFASRGEFARYINSRFEESGYFDDVDEPGVWEWLSLYYFDSVCPQNQDGVRKPKSLQRHLLNPPHPGKTRRHLLRNAYLLYRRYRYLSDVRLDLLLGPPLDQYPQAVTQIGERERTLNSKGVLIAANRLYLNKSTGKPKRGYTSGDAGILTFGRVVNNLPTRCDLSEMSADAILALLPPGFSQWLDDGSEDEDEIQELRETFAPIQVDQANSAQYPDIERFDSLLRNIKDRSMSNRVARVRSRFFRDGVITAYNFQCAISGLELIYSPGSTGQKHEVEAAHIKPVASGGRDLIQNGLALNRTVHWAFDLGMMWVDRDLKINVSEEVESDRRNEWLLKYRGRMLRLPKTPRYRPSFDALAWHAKNIADADVQPAA